MTHPFTRFKRFTRYPVRKRSTAEPIPRVKRVKGLNRYINIYLYIYHVSIIYTLTTVTLQSPKSLEDRRVKRVKRVKPPTPLEPNRPLRRGHPGTTSIHNTLTVTFGSGTRRPLSTPEPSEAADEIT